MPISKARYRKVLLLQGTQWEELGTVSDRKGKKKRREVLSHHGVRVATRLNCRPTLVAGTAGEPEGDQSESRIRLPRRSTNDAR